MDLTGKNIKDVKLVVNGAGAAGVACLELLKAMGMPNKVVLCVLRCNSFRRTENLNQ